MDRSLGIANNAYLISAIISQYLMYYMTTRRPNEDKQSEQVQEAAGQLPSSASWIVSHQGSTAYNFVLFCFLISVLLFFPNGPNISYMASHKFATNDIQKNILIVVIF